MLDRMARAALQLRGWLAGRCLDHDHLWTLNERANRTVVWGHRFHVLSACLFCCFLAGPNSFVEISAAVLVITAVGRLYATWRLYPALFAMPVMLLSVLTIAYTALALLWSPDRTQGLDELDAMRWALVVPALWPLRHVRGVLILCVTLGYLSANVCQLVQWLAFEFGWESLDFDAYPNRISGWLSPASGGSVLMAALGLHLPAALSLDHPLRRPARALAVCSLVSVLATGARGAWIAAALLLVVAVVYAVWRSPQRGRLVTGAAIAATVIGALAWFALGEQIRSRYVEGRDEVIAAFDSGKYNTSTGARINMLLWAGRALGEHPVLGVGTGGYQAWVRSEQFDRGIDPATQPVYGHAHSSPAHIGASQGAVGLALFGALAVVILLSAKPRDGEWANYQAGIWMALIGVLLAGILDVVHINSQTSAVLWTMVALSMRSSRPY